MATLFTGLANFINDMGNLPWNVKIWASLFPFPQIIVGGYMTATRGVSSPAGLIFGSRVFSFIVAGQIHERIPYGKIMGPFMHIPFLVSIPLCVNWLNTEAAVQDGNMANFITYTCAITTFSLLMDAVTAIKWTLGTDPGKFKLANDDKKKYGWILPIPSLIMAVYAFIF